MNVAFKWSKNHGSEQLSKKLLRILIPAEYERYIKTKIPKWENKDKHFFFVSQQISRDHKVALEVITYVGCTLSLVGESLTVVAYCLLM